jgi:hypothetical protein
MNVFGFLLNCSTSWKSCVKEQRPHLCITFTFLFYLTSWFVIWGLKEGGIYFESLKSWLMTASAQDKQRWIFFRLLVNKLRAYAVKAVKVDLLKQTTPKNCIIMPFLDTNSYLTTKLYHFDIKCQCKIGRTHFFWHQVKGGGGVRVFFFFFSSVGGFFNKRVIWGWLAGTPHKSSCKHSH